MKFPLRKACLLVILYFVGFVGTAQTISNFKINAPYACTSPGFNEFSALFAVENGVFKNDNQYVLELSDVNGEFNKNTVELARVDAFDGNSDIPFAFPVPKNVQSYGSDAFKIRLRSTSPATEAVIPYEYHWYDTNLTPIVLHNFKPLEICAQSSATIELSQKGHHSYIWYKDGQVIAGQNTYALSVTQAGKYYGEVDLGACITSYPGAKSNTIVVTVKAAISANISASATKICAGSTATLTAPQAPDYFYQWFKDGVEITGETNANLLVSTGGTYQCQMVLGDCSTVSNAIVIESFGSEAVEISPASPEVVTGENTTLFATGADSYQWKNEAGELLSEKNTLVVAAGGIYTVFAMREGFSCTVEKSVSVTEVAAPKLDTDEDGVFDDEDECPNTPGTTQNKGCPTTSTELIPKALTMNGDGINDHWILPAAYAGQPDVAVTIFATTGKIVLKTKNYRNTWPPATMPHSKRTTFFYYIIRKEGQILKKGTITVLK